MPTTTPDTGAYLLLGLAVIFGTLGLFVANTLVRFRNLRRDIEAIELLERR